MQVYPITGSPFQIETTPGRGGTAALTISARDSFNFTAAGLAAVVAQISTYLSSSKLTSIYRLTSSQVGVEIRADASGCSYPVLTADVAAQVTALTSILQTAANVST